MQLQFGDFTFDRAARRVLRDGQVRHLGPKAFDLLDLLLTLRPGVVAKERIRDRLWPATAVTESTLATVVAELRAALGDDPRHPRFIRTAHRVGYAFCGDVAETGAGGAAGTAAGRHRLLLEDGVVALAEGENLLGRDEQGAVCLDSPTVSRRHARIVIADGRAVLHDLGSKNGTFVGGRRISTPVVLHDGDDVRLGRVRMKFRVTPRDASTRTDGRS
jgi:DNA-binding winged helix-turn-helix (wHTH) protein